MEFVQKFTPPDFRAKNFTPSISPNFNSFSKKKHKKMSENGEIYTAGKNFTLPPALTAWTNSTSVKYIRTELTYVYCPKNDWKPRLFGRKDSLQKPRCHFPTLKTKYHDLLTEVLVCWTCNNIKLKSPTMAVRYPPLAKISGRRGTVALRPLGWKKSLHWMV